MLQEAGKLFSAAFDNNFVKKLSLYLHDCVREEVQSSTFRNLNQDKDNKWIFIEYNQNENTKTDSIIKNEKLFTNYPSPLKLDGEDPSLTELMIQGSNNQKDKYLIYGYLFLVGKNAKTKRKNEFLTPLLYCACTLERQGLNVVCSMVDEGLSLNTAALTSLMNFQGEEDEIDNKLDGLLDVVPKLPLKEEDLNIFLTTLKSLVPDIEFQLNSNEKIDNNIKDNNDNKESTNVNSENIEEIIEENEGIKTKTNIEVKKVVLINKSAIILTKRPIVTAGVLYELTKIAEKPLGTIRETALNIINEEYLQGQGKMPSKIIEDNIINDFVPITPLLLSNAQENVIKNLEDSTILSVYGPPGTGKSQTIVNLVCHLVAKGKTVLIVSRMDKAADVIADRLNGFGVPFLALRAGRANYQKELSLNLQDLLSGKTNIDTDFEDSILVDISDMKKLLNQIKIKENTCEDILKLEETWQNYKSELESLLKKSDTPIFIKGKYQDFQLEMIDNAIKKLEKYYSDNGIFSGLFTIIAKVQLQKILNIKNFDANSKNFEKIKLELETAKLDNKIKQTEMQLQKYENINQILQEIKILRNKRSKLAIDILKNKRRNSLKELLRDQVKRQRLIIHTKALTTKKQNLQYRLLEEEDFKPLLEAFPCWCVTSYAASNSLPLKPGMFDVAIIDEASQCDIASCIPILYRSKKAVIVGDDKQLPHLSFLEKSKEQSFLSQYEIPDKYQLMWRFRTNSMFDLANYYSYKPVLLDEHYRSSKSIIDFSNKQFYGAKMKIMTNFDDKYSLELIRVPDGKVDSEMTRNPREVEAIMQKLQEIINDDCSKENNNDYKPVTIGIVSPFRGQVELIKKALVQLYPEILLKKYNIEVGTAHTFQGDERDIMIISWAIADNSYSQSLTFLQMPNLFNVAITRAKKKQIVFLSKNPNSLPSGLLKDYIEYVSLYSNNNEQKKENEINLYKNDFEKEVAMELRNINFDVTAGKNIASVPADLYVKYKTCTPIVVECDGVMDNIKELKTPIEKHNLIERTGIHVERISYREWMLCKQGCIDRIKDIFITK